MAEDNYRLSLAPAARRALTEDGARPRVADRVVFEKLLRVLRFGCSYESIAES